MPEQSKSIFKSKTFWTNFGVGVGLMFIEFASVQLPVENSTIVVALAAANMFLRGLTGQPVHMATPESQKSHPPSRDY